MSRWTKRPATFTALLNALQMGFRSLAIEKRSSEVWQILGAVRGEFGKYNEVVDKLSKQLSTAAKSVESLGISDSRYEPEVARC